MINITFYFQGPSGVCSSCQTGKTTYIGKSADHEAAYGSSENPASSCWDLALHFDQIKTSKPLIVYVDRERGIGKEEEGEGEERNRKVEGKKERKGKGEGEERKGKEREGEREGEERKGKVEGRERED